MIKQNLIFMGQPGVGKGTVANILTKISPLKHVSTGNIFREEIANKTELGLQVEQIVTTGGYVPDSITNSIVLNAINKLQQNNDKFILDGYPRTIEQANFLASLKDLEFVAIELVAPENVILERLSGRRSCPKCKSGYHVKFQPPKVAETCDLDGETLITRKDDQPEAIKLRLDIYNKQTSPLIEYYQQKGMLIRIEAVETPEVIAKKVLEKIK
ncbi:adenylate kinase family protein [Mycoplasmopsis columboralis]|uniref:Adenylate kinase n=1 Tax=Mycoplasmopsis columboralis TaxID=171282 RepID=A0A449B6H1_9BACT|nr:nucleoside monophosphate kinase [Mycoplasmopsis columboralis]VEU76211.1 Adenylate kinase [Mycoplasmopsis columboralis]